MTNFTHPKPTTVTRSSAPVTSVDFKYQTIAEVVELFNNSLWLSVNEASSSPHGESNSLSFYEEGELGVWTYEVSFLKQEPKWNIYGSFNLLH